MNRKKLSHIVLIIIICSTILLLISPTLVLGQMTIPTRTPTPGAVEPTDPPPDPTDPPPDPTDPPPDPTDPAPNPTKDKPDPTDPPTENTPEPTVAITPTQAPIGSINTPQPSATSETATTAPTLAVPVKSTIDAPGSIGEGSQPVTSFLFPANQESVPTAETCGEPPTFTADKETDVFRGPGTDYIQDETLEENDVRPIVGRAVYAEWWLIQLNSRGDMGWVDDKDGTIHGYTGNVPRIEPPKINGEVPTRGPLWQPTANPECTPTPSPTATSVISGAGNSGNNVAAQEPVSAGNSVIDYSAISDGGDDSTVDDIRNSLAATAAPIEVPSPSPAPNLLPIAGLVLIIAAIFVALFLRRSPRSAGDEA